MRNTETFRLSPVFKAGDAIYDSGTYPAQMMILIHELAHKVMAPGIVHDGALDDPANASENNTSSVIEHCRVYLEFLDWANHQ